MRELLISEAFELYKNDYIRFKNQSVKTEENHEVCKKALLLFVPDKPISELSFDDVRDWKNYLSKRRSQNTVRNYIVRLRTVLNYLNIREIPCIKAGMIPVPKRSSTVPRFLTSEEVTAMINSACNIRAQFIVSLLYSSGIRLSELISLNRGQIVERRFTIIGKGSKPRLCFIDERTEQLMESYLATRKDNCEALIVSFQHRERINHTTIQLVIRNAARKAGLESKRVTPHTLRHSYATNFLKNNGNMRYLSAMMGHSSMDTTAMYAHVVDNDLEAQYRKFHSI